MWRENSAFVVKIFSQNFLENVVYMFSQALRKMSYQLSGENVIILLPELK
jgi:uncharacterized FAD-dependent dehydrogenase